MRFWFSFRTPVQHTCLSTLVSCVCQSRVREFFCFASSRITRCQSCFSNFSARTKASVSQSFLANKIGSVILARSQGNWHREQTAYLHRAIPEHRAARLGLHHWAAPGEVR